MLVKLSIVSGFFGVVNAYIVFSGYAMVTTTASNDYKALAESVVLKPFVTVTRNIEDLVGLGVCQMRCRHGVDDFLEYGHQISVQIRMRRPSHDDEGGGDGGGGGDGDCYVEDAEDVEDVEEVEDVEIREAVSMAHDGGEVHALVGWHPTISWWGRLAILVGADPYIK